MADRRNSTEEPAETLADLDLGEQDMPAEISLNVVPVSMSDGTRAITPVPTLYDAFILLCQALEGRLEENLPAQAHAQEIVGWHADGNVAVAWSHAIQLLEQVLDAKLTA